MKRIYTSRTLISFAVMIAFSIKGELRAQSDLNALVTQLDAIYSEQLTDDEPGGAVLIEKKNKVVFVKGYGLADLNSKEIIDENTVFNTGSISKTFVSNGILILQEKGMLSLEDNLNLYFDDFDNKELASKVKIKHLLSHSSGLPDNRRVSDNREFYLTAKDEENFAPIKQNKHFNFSPGSNFEYSNPAYNGLALIIEKVSEQVWQNFIGEQIFEVANMTSSTITNGPHPTKGVAHAYVKIDGEYQEMDYGEVPTFAAAGNSGVWSSVKELAKYERALQSGKIISLDLLDKSRRALSFPNWSGTNDPFIGYGWFTSENNLLGEGSNLGVSLAYHTGSQGGFRAFHVVIPEEEILFVGLFNKPLDDFRGLIRRTLNLLKENDWLD